MYSANSEDFKVLLTTAQSDISHISAQQYTQSIVCITASGNIYHTVLDNACTKEKSAEKAFLQSLVDKNDTVINKIVCIWSDKSLDVPSHDLREMICALHPDNANAGMLLQGDGGYVIKKISETIKE